MGTPGYNGPTTVLYKPQGEKGETVVMLPPHQQGYASVKIVTPDGQEHNMNTRHQKGERNEWKYWIPKTGWVPSGR